MKNSDNGVLRMPKKETKVKPKEDAPKTVAPPKKTSPKPSKAIKKETTKKKTKGEVEPEKKPTDIVDEEIELDEELGLDKDLEESKIEVVEDKKGVEETTSILPEVEYVEERLYVVPFSKLVYTPPNKRASKAIRLLRLFAVKHMKSEVVIIDQKVNEEIWSRGIKKPPRKIRVRMAKDKDGFVYVLPASF